MRRACAAALVVALLPALTLPAAAQARPAVNIYPVPPALDPPLSGGATAVEPAIVPAPDGADAEWFVVSGRSQAVVSIAPGGKQVLVARGLAAGVGIPSAYASVDAEGYDWILDNDQGPGNVLYAVGAADSPNPGINQVARFGDYGQAMALGPDGALYVADNQGVIRCRITGAPSAACSTAAVPPPFYTGAGAFAIGAGAGAVWFTDGLGEIGAYTSAGFSGPYPAAGVADGSIDPGTIVAAANGQVYVAGGGGGGGGGANGEILTFNPAGPGAVQVVASGLGNVVAMSLGPDGNIWFLDDSGSGYVGELNLSSGAVVRYALPSGATLPASGWQIADGPAVPNAGGTGEVFFTASTTGSDGQPAAAIGEVSGIAFPVVPGALAFKSAISVSRRHVAVLTLICSGQSNSVCQGRLRLTARSVAVRSAAAQAGRRLRPVLNRPVTTGPVTVGQVSYDVRGGRSVRAVLRLSNRAYRLLESAAGHRFTAVVTGAPKVGTVSGRMLALTGPPAVRAVAHKHR